MKKISADSYAPPRFSTTECAELNNLSALCGWQVDYQQQGEGAFEAWFELYDSAGLQITNQYSSREMTAVGISPPDHLALILPRKRGNKGVFQGRAMGANHAALMGPRAEGHYRTPAEFGLMVVTIPMSRFAQAVAAAGNQEVDHLSTETRIIKMPPATISHLASCINHALQLSHSASTEGKLDVCLQELEEHLVTSLGLALTKPLPPENDARGRASRLRSLSRTREYIEANLDAPLGMETLARVAEVSTRTLNTAFREVLNVTIVQYIRHCRLNAAKHRLLHSDSTNSSVSSIGRAYGFSHLSRFAGEYHALFDEYPSQTLKKNKSEKREELR